MNIFVLDHDPRNAANYQCDKHVIKMCLETAQLLCSVFNDAPYKRTHYNHPCSKWVRESSTNFQWLLDHGIALCDEYSNRYQKTHKSLSVILWCRDNFDTLTFQKSSYTNHPLCMPDDCKIGSVVESYRNYYIHYKRDFATWKKSPCPYWWK